MHHWCGIIVSEVGYHKRNQSWHRAGKGMMNIGDCSFTFDSPKVKAMIGNSGHPRMWAQFLELLQGKSTSSGQACLTRTLAKFKLDQTAGAEWR